jgi:hypothetical protein
MIRFTAILLGPMAAFAQAPNPRDAERQPITNFPYISTPAAEALHHIARARWLVDC